MDKDTEVKLTIAQIQELILYLTDETVSIAAIKSVININKSKMQ